MSRNPWYHKTMNGTRELLKALAKNEREERLAAMRDGRVLRATSIDSGKRYKRGTKHRGKGYDE